MFRAEDWVEESKGERGLQGVQEQHARVRRTFFLPQHEIWDRYNSQILTRCVTLELFGLDSGTQN